MRCGNQHSGSCLRADVLERSIVQIAKHGVGLPVVLLWIDVGILADVRIGAEKILVSVIVKIVDSRAPATHLEAAKTNACHVSIGAEEAVAFVAEHRKRLHLRPFRRST